MMWRPYSHQCQWILPWTSSITNSSRIHCSTIGPPFLSKIVTLLEFCLKNTFFTFQGKYYQLVQGAVMGSPISPVVANLVMEDFKAKMLSTSPNPPRIWLTYVDDTFVVHKAEHTQQFLIQLNSLNLHKHFTTETPHQQGSLPFLDTLVSADPNGSLITTVFRKPTHRPILTLQQPSQHHQQIQHLQHTYTQGQNCLFKLTVIRTGISAYQNALSWCKYPDWVLHSLQTKMDYKLSIKHCNNNPNPQRDTNTNKHTFIEVPYSKGLNKSFKNICGKVGVQVHFKGNNTVKDFLVAPKDRGSIVNKGGVIYGYNKCDTWDVQWNT